MGRLGREEQQLGHVFLSLVLVLGPMNLITLLRMCLQCMHRIERMPETQRALMKLWSLDPSQGMPMLLMPMSWARAALPGQIGPLS